MLFSTALNNLLLLIVQHSGRTGGNFCHFCHFLPSWYCAYYTTCNISVSSWEQRCILQTPTIKFKSGHYCNHLVWCATVTGYMLLAEIRTMQGGKNIIWLFPLVTFSYMTVTPPILVLLPHILSIQLMTLNRIHIVFQALVVILCWQPSEHGTHQPIYLPVVLVLTFHIESCNTIFSGQALPKAEQYLNRQIYQYCCLQICFLSNILLNVMLTFATSHFHASMCFQLHVTWWYVHLNKMCTLHTPTVEEESGQNGNDILHWVIY